jgi:hypothetical protein
MSNSINNLNVFTFIKDIYHSLKNIDKYFNDFNTNINSRLIKLEDNQLIIVDKLSSIELFLSKLNETNTSNVLLNKSIENELLEKMKIMNYNTINNTKVNLNPDELTFENILENNYSISDINQSLLQSFEIEEKSEKIDLDFKSCSSGSNYYSNSNSNSSSSSSSSSNSNSSSDVITNNLNNLLF